MLYLPIAIAGLPYCFNYLITVHEFTSCSIEGISLLHSVTSTQYGWNQNVLRPYDTLVIMEYMLRFGICKTQY